MAVENITTSKKIKKKTNIYTKSNLYACHVANLCRRASLKCFCVLYFSFCFCFCLCYGFCCSAVSFFSLRFDSIRFRYNTQYSQKYDTSTQAKPLLYMWNGFLCARFISNNDNSNRNNNGYYGTIKQKTLKPNKNTLIDL